MPSVGVRYKNIFPACAIYAVLPVLVFTLTWLQLPVAIVVGALVVLGVAFAIRSSLNDEKNSVFCAPYELSLPRGDRTPDHTAGEGFRLTPIVAILVVAIAAAWCFFGGQGGFWYQSSDWEVRNALFRDLITHEWPVVYEDGVAAMSYYIAYWLPAALPGRLLYSSGMSLDEVWQLSNVLLLIWTTIGMVLVELLVLCLLRPRHAWSALGYLLGLVFFATPDLIGMLVTGHFESQLEWMHFEWWADVAQMSSITSCLFWVFNQTVISWICVLCFLQERSIGNYVFLGVCCFASGPMPCVGLFLLMLVVALAQIFAGVREHVALKRLGSFISVQNIAFIAPAAVFVCYFLVNIAVANTSSMATTDNVLTYPLWLPADPDTLFDLMTFVVVEGLLLPVIILRRNWRSPLFWTMTLVLSLVAFIKVGSQADFCMRASVPAVMTLYVLCWLTLRRDVACIAHERGARVVASAVFVGLLSAVLLVGAATPAMEFYRGFFTMSENNWQAPKVDSGTLANYDFEADLANFCSTRYRESLFYGYLARI